jgi:hypothetical protein
MLHTHESVSPQQLAANRANAAKSTGPKSSEGKARSAQNARKHGFTAANFAVVKLEDIEAVARLKDDLIAVYQPVNSQELFAIERIALAQNALIHASTLEAGILTSCMNESAGHGDFRNTWLNDCLVGDLHVHEGQRTAFSFAEGLYLKMRNSNIFPLILRYQSQAERMYRRAIEDLDRLRALREDLPNEPETPEPEETKPETPPEPESLSPPQLVVADPVPALSVQPVSEVRLAAETIPTKTRDEQNFHLRSSAFISGPIVSRAPVAFRVGDPPPCGRGWASL